MSLDGLGSELEMYFQRSLCLERHLWVNQVGPVRCAYGRPVLLVREIEKIDSEFAIFPLVKDACVQCKLRRYLDRSGISDVNRTSNFSAKAESQAEIKLIVDVGVEQMMRNAWLEIVGLAKNRAIWAATTTSDRRQECVEHARRLLTRRLVVQNRIQIAVA